MKIYDGQIPFDVNGDLMHYADPPSSRRIWDAAHHWDDNEVFEDTLYYVTYHRGRSAAYFEFNRMSNQRSVCVFLADFEAMIPLMQKGQITGTFTYCKRGVNFGCKLVQ